MKTESNNSNDQNNFEYPPIIVQLKNNTNDIIYNVDVFDFNNEKKVAYSSCQDTISYDYLMDFVKSNTMLSYEYEKIKLKYGISTENYDCFVEQSDCQISRVVTNILGFTYTSPFKKIIE